MVSCLMIRPAEEFLVRISGVKCSSIMGNMVYCLVPQLGGKGFRHSVRSTLIISMEQNRLKTLSCTN